MSINFQMIIRISNNDNYEIIKKVLLKSPTWKVFSRNFQGNLGTSVVGTDREVLFINVDVRFWLYIHEHGLDVRGV